MKKEILTSEPLPYTMGNCGDLIKHGLLAEFINWYSQNINKELTFYDPFGGRPWQNPIHSEVLRRIKLLKPCALKLAQDSNDLYYGSGHIVKNISRRLSTKVQVLTSDRDDQARKDLSYTGLPLISLNGFKPEDAYSIFNADREENALILIDPFYDLEYINQVILTEIEKVVINTATSVVLYVLYDDNEIDNWSIFQNMNQILSQKNVRAISLECKAMEKSPIKGESKFHSYVILYASNQYPDEKLCVLKKEISDYAKKIESVIEHLIYCDYTCIG